jgi:hypothetical protein
VPTSKIHGGLVLTTQNASRSIHPQIPDPITKTVLQTLFTPTYDEKRWAARTVRSVSYQVALLTQLKLFQILGRDVAARYYRTLLANCTSANGKALEALRHPRTVVDEIAIRPASGNASATANH